ncbi:hypothetical protein SISNIDRAFT_462349 [Sistotremastrum niveocremeum HHB9708]|uniref:Uncharacterized protein n=1 Tax=Sistotremastrum niveocremeum HHB9708 TaxID=1314777 RepID=A0A165A291_9AGAM|nr:hypothetical protein SISNIDRAFT_462349 [Sistotremastrum niveocremeum HHB9708]
MNVPAYVSSLVLSYLRANLPPWLYDILAKAFVSIYGFILFLRDLTPEALNSQNVLPPLMTVIALYFTIMNIYRTTSFIARMMIFIGKWGAIVGLLGYLLSQVGGPNGPNALQQGGNGGAPNLLSYIFDFFLKANDYEYRASGSSAGSRSKSRKKAAPKRKPPRIYDTFDARQAYAEEQLREAEAGGGVIDDVITQISGQAQQVWKEKGKGWWEAIGKAAGFTSDEDEEPATGRRTSSRPRAQKGQGWTR